MISPALFRLRLGYHVLDAAALDDGFGWLAETPSHLCRFSTTTVGIPRSCSSLFGPRILCDV